MIFDSTFMNVLNYSYIRLHEFEEHRKSKRFAEEVTAREISEFDSLRNQLAQMLFDSLYRLVTEERELFQMKLEKQHPTINKLIAEIYK